jgi:hypothetical protein
MSDDPVEDLRIRVDAAQAAVERLAAAAREAGAGEPGAAYEIPRAGTEAAGEVHGLAAVVAMARAVIPEELWAQLVDLVRGLLLLVRALVDGWIARLEGPPAAPPAVHDVPVA